MDDDDDVEEEAEEFVESSRGLDPFARCSSRRLETDPESSEDGDDDDDTETLANPWVLLIRFSWIRSSARTRREL